MHRKHLKIDKSNIGKILFAGHRIGKGEGFSDLEYGLMEATGLVSEKTVIVTTVHDEQVCKNYSTVQTKTIN